MVVGLDRFREEFKEYTDQYFLIGGTACFIQMEEIDLNFRATKDLDIVLCMEVLKDDFSAKIWAFIESGQYKNRQRSDGRQQFFRFQDPEDDSYPKMLELFSRLPDGLRFEDGGRITPIPTGDKITSLSAILLNDDYYDFMIDGRRVLQDLSVLKVEYLIPLKAKAFTDNYDRKERGEDIMSINIHKHKKDVFRLAQMLSAETKMRLPGALVADMRDFMTRMDSDPIEVTSFIPGTVSKEQLLEAIRGNYENLN